VQALFQSPTVAGLARAVKAAQEADDALQILQMVEGLSDDEANEMKLTAGREWK
jgi:hypothetical protein